MSRAAEPAPAAHSSVAVEALSRLKGVDLESNPALKAAVLKVIESTKGTPQFVELVRDFHIEGQEAALLDFAARHPNDASGVDAVRLVLAGGDTELLKRALAGPDGVQVATALGNSAEKKAVPLLQSLVTDAHADAALTRAVVHALGQTQEGAKALLGLVQIHALNPDLTNLAGSELHRARWPEVKAAADRLRPESALAETLALPPVSELVRQKGDPARGAEVFTRPTVGCINCHQVHGQGTDFGPDLSEIGTKLAKEALYEAILDPSAGIAFGYEPWQIELRNGDEAVGLLASETADEVAIKAQTGIVSRYRKADIAKRLQLKTSMMPAGLAQTMSRQDLVDLVEYLASLRKKG